MGSSFRGPANPNDRFLAGIDDFEKSGPPNPPDRLFREESDGSDAEDTKEPGEASGGE